MNEKNELEEENETEEVEEAVEEKFTARLKEDAVIVGAEDAQKVYERGFYGEIQDDGTLKLSPVESLLLVERNRLEVLKDNNEVLNFQALTKIFMKSDPNLWLKYLVYRDLRSRGYVVRSGYGGNIDFRLYPRGAKLGTDTSKSLIYIVSEGAPIGLEDLDRVTRLAVSTRKRLTMAVVNRQGEVTYYQVSQVSI
ncbi:MAG: tRNA-intron lyase [Candidatus Freyarchaeota archaeon]|nr:tRNA-intron lyase [Candidatus Jordarchaeia archaeon]MBS7268397.1 tRNA-intron lyase [Candidatus Jordarchaeia archaeon]MBS7280176.1 tRNA-intron lyase [Candidatus Jordarchaeia archaeon]